MGIRKNQANLTPAERGAFVKAVLALKNTAPSRLHPDDPSRHRYDDYVEIHMNSMMASPGWAHSGPAFGPWHRYLLSQFEVDLQVIDPNVTLPYWDWTADNSPDPTVPGSPWTDDFMGGDGDPGTDRKVMSGPFAFDAGNWTLNVITGADPETEARDDVQYLRREFGVHLPVNVPPTLPAQVDVANALLVVPYDAPNWDRFVSAGRGFRNRLEGWVGTGSLHNRVHLLVGGTMLAMTSPNDPVFWLNHCNVDRLWAQWQQQHPTEGYHPTGLAPEIGPAGHNLGDVMIFHDGGQPAPWAGSVTPASVLDHRVLGYVYDTEPVEAPPAAPLRVAEAIVAAIPEREGGSEMATPMTMRGEMPHGPMFDLSPEDKAAAGIS
jgi:tyrosinase